MKEPSGMEMVAKAEELELSRHVEFWALEGEDINSLPSSFAEFSKSLGMPLASFEKEICALIRKLESRKGRRG